MTLGAASVLRKSRQARSASPRWRALRGRLCDSQRWRAWSVEHLPPAEAVEFPLGNDGVGTCGKFDRAVLVMHDRCTRFGRTEEHRTSDEAEQSSCGDG